MAEENARQAAAWRETSKERARQEEVEHIAAFDVMEKLRKNSVQQPIQKYLPVYDNPKKDLGYVEPIKIGVITPPEFLEGTKFDTISAMI